MRLLVICLLLLGVPELANAQAFFAPKETSRAAVSGDVVETVEIVGNQRIESSSIQSYMTIRSGDRFNQGRIDESLKSLFATGFFADVSIVRDGQKLVVKVEENPIINQVAFEGNKRIEDDNLKNEVQLKPRGIFTRTKVQQDVKRILEIYRRSGRFSAEVEPKVIPLEQNRVNLVFEIKEGEVTGIKKILFIGNKVFDSEKLSKVVRTRESRWYRFFSSDDTYDPDRLLYDQELLRRFYVSHGYADFEVKSAIAELTPERDGFYLTFTVSEGELYHFGKVGVRSELPDLSAEQLMEHIKTKDSEVFNAALIEESIDDLVKVLGDFGYAFVKIDPDIRKDDENRIIDLTYVISEGPRVYVERINIRGNVRTLDQVVRREFRLAEGDPYNVSKLRRSEQRIRNLGFFENVKITTEPGSAPDKTVINVDVAEQSTGELSLGAGFSTVDGALADVGIRESNLLGRGQSLDLRTMLASERQEIDLSFTEPYFLGRDLSAGFDVFSIKQDLRSESSFDRETKGVTLRMGYSLSERLRHTLNYSLRQDNITDVQPGASRFIRDQEGETTTSLVGHSLLYDARDNKFDPSAGYFVKFNQDIAGLGGDVSFLRNELSGGYYYAVRQGWVLSLLGKGGYIFGLDEDVLIKDRFFIGSRDMRGFNRAGIGPRDRLTNDALGGNVYYVATTELMFPLGLPDELGFRGAIFVDAGNLFNVDDSGPEVVDNDSIRMSTGVGVAWTSPFGPIRLDIAQAFAKEDIDETETVRFSFGTRF